MACALFLCAAIGLVILPGLEVSALLAEREVDPVIADFFSQMLIFGGILVAPILAGLFPRILFRTPSAEFAARLLLATGVMKLAMDVCFFVLANVA